MRRWKHIQSLGTSKSESKHLRCDFQELKEITKKIESIAEQAMEIKTRIVAQDRRAGDRTAASSSSRAAPVHQDSVVGLDDDLMEIKSRLCGESSKLEVIPIVGMGGIGKTTLARNAYDDPLTVEHFEVRVWVTVSQEYSLRETVTGMLLSMKVLDTKDEAENKVRVYKSLKCRRYLIVLDDMWNVQAWDDFQMMFPDDGNGSRIMLTTRLADVASYADTYSHIHEMRLMGEYQSWELLRQKVFKQDPCPDELEYFGKKIAGSCRGLPLAIVLISGLVSLDQTTAAWCRIADDVHSAISGNDDQMDRILSLSYTHLPHQLRPCFLYIGGFPEDYEMRVSKLIKLWVAEGFLKPNGCNKSLEETGQEYLEDLVKRSLVLVRERDYSGKMKSFSIHDVIRELCRRKAEEENFIVHVGKTHQEGAKIPRRLTTFRDDDLDFLENADALTIRTVICLKNRRSWPGRLRFYRLLRTLDLLNVDNSVLPGELFELFHLRYLAFDHALRIPAAISNLRYLQTLIIGLRKYREYERPYFVELPVEIWRMPQLRHIIAFFSILPFKESSMVTLENMQTLSVVRNFSCSRKMLQMFPNLKRLRLSYTSWRDTYEEDYQLHNLMYLQQLESLKLVIEDDFPYPENVYPVFPPTLRKLTLSHLRLPWFYMKIVGSLPNLEVLKLRDYAYIGDTWKTTEGEFPELNFLLIDESDLEHWITESSHFPRLKCLIIHRCEYLREIPFDIGEIPTLELIEVDDRNDAVLDSAEQIHDYQQSCGNDALQVMTYISRLEQRRQI